MNSFTARLLAQLGLASGLWVAAYAQGPLVPTTAPTPSMKTLDQIQPATPVNAIRTPGNATNQFVITLPGAYYLTGNIAAVAAKNGISIQSDDVTLDLSGFAVAAPAGGTVSPIAISALKSRIRISNGIITGGANGITGSPAASTFEKLVVNGATGAGITAG